LTAESPSTLSTPVSARRTSPERQARSGNARRAWRRFSANRPAIVALIVCLVLVLLAIGAPLVTRYITHVGPNKQSLIHNFQPRGDGHWLGTDEYGRDVLTRLIYGMRVSLGVAALATLVAVLVGTAVGAASAFYGGIVDQLLMRLVDVMLSIPGIYVLILIGALFRVGPFELAVMIAFIGWYQLARLIRAEVLSIRQREFVEAARVIGAPGRTIILRHVMPNVTHLLVVFTTSAIPSFILLEAAMSFLGLGIQAPTASLGSMLIGSTQYLYKRPALIFFPGLTITVIALMVSIVGNALRDALDPRLNG
jgi:ABC-type dipeptide/oligopeptide/nickel transport system permease subunit